MDMSSIVYYGSTSSARSGYWAAPGSPGFFNCDGEPPRHFLDSCVLCKKPLRGNCDIYMYRGDTPFCSVECRQEQIEADEEAERCRTMAAMKTAATGAGGGEQKQKKSERAGFRPGAVVAG